MDYDEFTRRLGIKLPETPEQPDETQPETSEQPRRGRPPKAADPPLADGNP